MKKVFLATSITINISRKVLHHEIRFIPHPYSLKYQHAINIIQCSITPLKSKVILYIKLFKDYFSLTENIMKTNWLIPFRELITLYHENCIKNIQLLYMSKVHSF
jgi:hypothetical protein